MQGQVKAGRAIASFIFPPVGFITYFIKKSEDKKAARSYLIISGVSMAFILLNYAWRKHLINQKSKLVATKKPISK